MANLSNIEDLSLPINRQNLYNMWATATLGTIDKTDLSPSLFTMDVGDYLTGATSSPQPGASFFSKEDRLMFVFHDVIDDTGVSLWLAVGPDRFDVACLANSPVPAGAVVQFDYDKWVGISTGASGNNARNTPIGTCAAGIDLTNTAVLETQASGAWIPVSIDGMVFGATEETIGDGWWVRVQDGSPGFITRSSTSLPQPQLGDDVVGLGLQDLSGSTATPVHNRFTWTGPRVINEL